MVLIISENNDESTNDVIDWLDSYGLSFQRINLEDNIDFEYLDNIKVILNKNNIEKIDLSKVKSFWYRRGGVGTDFFDRIKTIKNTTGKTVSTHLLNEYLHLASQSYFLLDRKKSINSYFNGHLNKLTVLTLAKEYGLEIPDYMVTNQKMHLVDFYKKTNEQIITKAINSVFSLVSDEQKYLSYSELITKEFIGSLDEVFFPSFFQRFIDKQFDIRVFYLDGKFYPMAIFSQGSEQTRVDFRKYDRKNPNRKVPYKLSENIQNQLKALLDRLRLNCASIDLIQEKVTNKTFFLEINPVGQFGMVSKPCNYPIEQQIAQFLQ